MTGNREEVAAHFATFIGESECFLIVLLAMQSLKLFEHSLGFFLETFVLLLQTLPPLLDTLLFLLTRYLFR
jgi:hypothetical protein